MTIDELIEKLEEYPPDMLVLHYDDENLILSEVKWVGEMGDNKVAGVVVHRCDPAEEGDWLTCA